MLLIYFEAGREFSLHDTIQQIKERVYSETDRTYDSNTCGPVDMNLALVIDEASHLKGMLDGMSTLSKAVTDLKALVKGHVRLIFAWTGYDSIVDNISSKVDVFKHDMRPWSQGQSNLYIMNFKEFCHDEKESIIRCMDKFPILTKLPSNGIATSSVRATILSNHCMFTAKWRSGRYTWAWLQSNVP